MKQKNTTNAPPPPPIIGGFHPNIYVFKPFLMVVVFSSSLIYFFKQCSQINHECKVLFILASIKYLNPNFHVFENGRRLNFIL